MLENVITSIDQVSTKWITSALVRSGALTHGTVSSFEIDAGKGNWSTNASLIIRYTEDAEGLLPQRLFLKMVDTNLGNNQDFDESEVSYYTQDYVDTSGAPLLQCYDAGYSKELKRYHILLDDVAQTHVEAAAKEPTLEYGTALAEGLAVLHARWWGAQHLSKARVSMHSASQIQNFVDTTTLGVEYLLSRFSSEMKPHWQGVLYELFAKHPQAMIQRTRNPNGFTLIHGDVGSRNVLVPQQSDRPIYIIDRQPFQWALTTWLGVYDIAYAIVLDWETETRRKYENIILQRYHEYLIQKGILDYSWEQLVNDYRLCVPMCVYITTELFRGDVNERWIHVCLQMFQRALTTCDDLDCNVLWQDNLP